MEKEANPDAEKAAWTVKSMNVEARKLAVAAAEKRGETMAEWLERAVRTQANLEAGDRVIPPGERDLAPSPAPAAAPVPDIGSVVELVRAAVEIAAAAGLPVPKAAARQVMALTTETLLAARGLPKKQPSLPPRKTGPVLGQTINPEN